MTTDSQTPGSPPIRPRILITGKPVDGLRCVDDLPAMISNEHGKIKWQRVLEHANAMLDEPPLTPHSLVPGRSESNAKLGIRDYGICATVGNRLICAALVHLHTGEQRYVDASLRQIETVYDESAWPSWVDQAHLHFPCDLRTGMFGYYLSVAYDWLHGSLTGEQRSMIVAGLEQRAFEPFWKSVEAGAGFANGTTNWMTVIVGGMGIAGMALGEDYAGSAKLIDYALPRMLDYFDNIGPEGEFNESPGYAGSLCKPAAFFQAYRYFTGGRENHLVAEAMIKACYWIMYTTTPPGCVTPIGDGHIGAKPQVLHFAAVADAANDPILQQFYLDHCVTTASHGDPAGELLSYNPALAGASPAGLPLGRAFKAHSGIISSRSSWDKDSAVSVVFSKAGHGREGHGHHDNGEVCIDGHGRRLLTDMGMMYYPEDFFTDKRYEYYFGSVRGHSVPQIGGRETRGTAEAVAQICHSQFDDQLGGSWQLDLTPLYEGVKQVSRTVIHLLPGVVAVLDEIVSETEEELAIRWHTFDRCEPSADGQFVVANDGVHLASQVVRLDGPVSFVRDEHRHRPGYDKDRTGQPLPDLRPSYVDAKIQAQRCRVLSMFAVFGENEPIGEWKQTNGSCWEIGRRGGDITVSASSEELLVEKHQTEHMLRMNLLE